MPRSSPRACGGRCFPLPPLAQPQLRRLRLGSREADGTTRRGVRAAEISGSVTADIRVPELSAVGYNYHRDGDRAHHHHHVHLQALSVRAFPP